VQLFGRAAGAVDAPLQPVIFRHDHVDLPLERSLGRVAERLLQVFEHRREDAVGGADGSHSVSASGATLRILLWDVRFEVAVQLAAGPSEPGVECAPLPLNACIFACHSDITKYRSCFFFQTGCSQLGSANYSKGMRTGWLMGVVWTGQ
jgi:hypothetical protein